MTTSSLLALDNSGKPDCPRLNAALVKVVFVYEDGEVFEIKVSQGAAQTKAQPCGTFSVSWRRPGRPRATAQPFAYYVCAGWDAEAVREEFAEALRSLDGTARAVALTEKRFIDEGKIAGIIPWKLLKKEFGELVTFGRTRFDDMIRLYELRQ